MSVSNVRRVFFGVIISATGLALATPFSQPGVAAASTVSRYATGTTGVVAPSQGVPSAASQTVAPLMYEGGPLRAATGR